MLVTILTLIDAGLSVSLGPHYTRLQEVDISNWIEEEKF